MSGFDVAEVAENAANKTVERALQAIYEPVATFVGVTRAKFFEDFSAYYGYVNRKCQYVRTIISKNKSELLSSIYVESRFKSEMGELRDSQLISRVRRLERVIVKGAGGSGKTIFLKHLWLSLCSNPDGRIPLFVELRRLNDLTTVNVMAFCRSELQSNSIFSDSVFERMCVAGKFAFVFDGFDELSGEIRKSVEKQIIAMAFSYGNCGFVLSSRDDDRFGSWQNFTIYSICDLNLQEVILLIEKIDFEDKSKGKFIDNLDKKFYEKNKQFLATPLLVTMMLMTFYQNASIPDRLSTFYKNAFQTMLLWHDATKDSYERQRFLSIENFRIVFSVFCLISYFNNKHDFDEDTLRNTISKSIDYSKNIEQLRHLMASDVESIKMDFWQSANLIQKDGRVYNFLHRSFQEYFAAECVMTIINDNVAELISKFSRRHGDSSLLMCYEIQPDKVIDDFLMPTYERLKKCGVFSRRRGVEVCRLFHFAVTFNFGQRSVSFDNNSLASGLLWPEVFDELVAIDKLFGAKDLRGLALDGLTSLFDLVNSVEFSDLFDANYKLKVWFQGGILMKYSLSSVGSKKIPATRIAEVRKIFGSKLVRVIDVTELNLRRQTYALGVRLADISSGRKSREKSIEEILDL